MSKKLLSIIVLSIFLSGLGTSLASTTSTKLRSTTPQETNFRQNVYIESHQVDVSIRDQVARTRIKQVFVNEGPTQAEGTYIFPLPSGVTISDLTMYIDGVPIESKILERDEARRIYDEIVRQLRDPALLEYVGTNAIQASVFPIPPNEKRTLEIEYNQLLTVENGLIHYVYPVRTRHLSVLPVGQLSIRVEVESNDPISSIYSPSHRIAIDRDGEYRFVAGFETTNTLEANDFSLYYGLASDEINLNLLTYRESADEDGFFLLLVSPPVEVDTERVIPKDVTLILDQSGSMYGEKWEQAIKAAKFVLDNLNPQDRFNIVVFSTGVRKYANEMQPISEVNDAKEFLDNLEAEGGTNIDAALQTALESIDRERPSVILFLTDGLPTEGVTDTAEILENLEIYTTPNVRIFTFGVGDDVDTFLLDQISTRYQGASSYVRPTEAVDEAVSSLYSKISAPVLTNVELEFEGINVYDLQPANITDLFVGSQLVIAGRYRGSADNATLKLSGEVDDTVQTFVYDDLEFRANAGGEVLIPRLWATRRIGEMLNAIRLYGENQELIDSIVRLSIRYGIITPYTSFLITEDDVLSQTGRERAVEEAEAAADDLGRTVSGEAAVNSAVQTNEMQDTDFAAAPLPTMTSPSATTNTTAPYDGNSTIYEPIRIVGDRTFILRDGVWLDTLYNPDEMTPVEIKFLSEEYFALLDEDERVAQFYALGERVVFVLDGIAYAVIE